MTTCIRTHPKASISSASPVSLMSWRILICSNKKIRQLVCVTEMANLGDVDVRGETYGLQGLRCGVLEHFLHVEGTDLTEKREVEMANDDDNRVKVQAKITRRVGTDVMTFNMTVKKGIVKVTCSPGSNERTELDFRRDWEQLWVPQLPRGTSMTPFMTVAASLDPYCTQPDVEKTSPTDKKGADCSTAFGANGRPAKAQEKRALGASSHPGDPTESSVHHKDTMSPKTKAAQLQSSSKMAKQRFVRAVRNMKNKFDRGASSGSKKHMRDDLSPPMSADKKMDPDVLEAISEEVEVQKLESGGGLQTTEDEVLEDASEGSSTSYLEPRSDNVEEAQKRSMQKFRRDIGSVREEFMRDTEDAISPMSKFEKLEDARIESETDSSLDENGEEHSSGRDVSSEELLEAEDVSTDKDKPNGDSSASQ